jgi:hypothetical protein
MCRKPGPKDDNTEWCNPLDVVPIKGMRSQDLHPDEWINAGVTEWVNQEIVD